MMEDYWKTCEFQRWLALWGTSYVDRYNARKRDDWLTTWGKVYAAKSAIENQPRNTYPDVPSDRQRPMRNPVLNDQEQEFTHRMADAGTPTVRNVYGYVPWYDEGEVERRALHWLRQWRRFNEPDDGYESMNEQ